MNSVMSTLTNFGDIFGQVVSIDKTSILFSENVDASTRRKLIRLTDFKETFNLVKC